MNTDVLDDINDAAEPFEQIALGISEGIIFYYFDNGVFSIPGIHERADGAFAPYAILCVSVQGDGNCGNFYGCWSDADCDDQDSCTDDVCNLSDGSCLNAPADCDDGFTCTIDSCDRVQAVSMLPTPCCAMTEIPALWMCVIRALGAQWHPLRFVAVG